MQVNGVELYPAAGMLVMAIEAARQVASRPEAITGFRLLEVSFPKALVSVPRAQDFETNMFLRPLRSSETKASRASEFRIYTLTNGDWAENCRGTITLEYENENENNEVDCGNEVKMELEHCKQVYATAIKSCLIPLKSEVLYELLESMGLSYGDTFQTLDEVRYSGCEAVGRVKLRKWATVVNERDYQAHIIHPTALDGLLQLVFAAIPRAGQTKAPTMVPEQIEEVWISARGLAEPSSDSVKAYAKCTHHDLREARCTIMALDNITHEPRIMVRNLQASTVDSQSISSSSSTAWKRLCYRIIWMPDVELLNQEELRSYCPTVMPADLPSDKVFHDMEFMCYNVICDALERINQDQNINVKPQFDLYVQWMKRQSHRYDLGEMAHWRPEWPKLRCDKNYTQSVLSHVENSSPEGKLYAEIGKNLPGILEGKVNALDLLYADKLGAEYYTATNRSLEMMEPYIDAFAHKYPGLNILEIGAGTGSATTSMLQWLMRPGEGDHGVPRYARYTFTDLSPQFFEKAKERYAEHVDRMVFAPLNIEEDPRQQGFSENAYDLVVAVNVR